MGCGKVCQAKKKAKEAEKEAEKARREADEAMKNLPKSPDVPKLTGAEVNVVTVGHVLGVHETKNAMTPKEVNSLLVKARNEAAVAVVAGEYIDLTQAAYGAYTALFYGQMAANIAKPAARIAVQINGIITFNFAMLGELLGDVVLLLLTIFVGLAPIMLSIMKNILLSIPVDIAILLDYQLDQLKNLIALSKVEIKKAFDKSVKNTKAYQAIPENITMDNLSEKFGEGMRNCIHEILNNLSDELEKININILEIEDVDVMDDTGKGKVGKFVDSMLEGVKKIEKLQASEILERNFLPFPDKDDDTLAIKAEEIMRDLINTGSSIDDAFLDVFHKEVEKNKNKLLEVREDLEALDLARDLILKGKGPFVSSMANKIDKINLDKTSFIELDDCYEQQIANEFTILKSVVLTQQVSFINTTNVTNTAGMINLKDSVFANAEYSIGNSIITIDQECQKDFLDSVCDSIERFKNHLYSAVKIGVDSGDISIDELKLPEGVNRYEVKKMITLLLNEVKKKILKQTSDIIIHEVVPCKACRPCEEMILDMNVFISKSILKIKELIIRHIRNAVLNSGRDWEVTDAQSVEEHKSFLISQLTAALQKPSGELGLVDDMISRIIREEEELLKTIRTSLRAL